MRKLKLFHSGNSRHLLLICALWILVFAWIAVCISLSSQTGEETGKLSGSMASFFAEVFHLPQSQVPELNRNLRIIAHFICFFILSLLFGSACSATFPKSASAFAWPLLPCIAFAFIDEFRKAGIPGRHCSIPEAWLNAAGCILGTVLIGVILWALHRRK
jgi:VanZ family protein